MVSCDICSDLHIDQWNTNLEMKYPCGTRTDSEYKWNKTENKILIIAGDISDNLDLSIDYMASTLTGDDPLSLGVSQSALGRLTRAKQARVRTQETKLKLQDIIKEVISEQDVPQQIEKAVESDADLEELLSAMAERLRELESEMEKVKSDYSAASSRMNQIIGQQK